MINKIYFLKILLNIFFIFFTSLAFSDDLEFNASEISTYEKGNLIKGVGGVKIDDGLGLIITGEKFEFNKLQSILKVNEKVLVKDSLNNLIRSDQIVFYKKLNIVKTKDKTIIELKSGHTIQSSNITFNRNLNTFFSNDKTVITDLNNNKLNMNKFTFSIKERILKGDDVIINDSQGNIQTIKKILYNLKTNSFSGKDLSTSFNSNNFNSNKNEPRLKGNAFFYNDNITRINKGVFTTCEKNDSCPPWAISAKEIEHNKITKTINYKNAWLKIYDLPVLYFPRFFHPDPTVKRQSGFLTPGFSQSSNNGNYFSTPYFYAMSESTDLTFSPRFYDNGSSIYQGEYRNIKEKSEHMIDVSIKSKNILDFKQNNNSTSSHFFSNSEFELDLYNFEQSGLKIKIQQTSDDDYLKTYKLKSPIIQNANVLNSSVNFNASRDDLELGITAEIYENLNLKESDRYEYVFPNFSMIKDISEFKGGNLSLYTNALSKQYQTNIKEDTLVNDLTYKSYNKISMLGLVSNYEVLIKNFNIKSRKSNNYNNKTENNIQSIINYEIKYPLQKIKKNFLSRLTPVLSARYSPNQSKNKSNSDSTINYENIFSLNRMAFSDTVEGGQSITLGSEYELYDKKNNDKKILSANLATVIRDVQNNRLPIKSTLGQKNSDIFGNIDFLANKYINFNYNFSLDSDLETVNLNKIKSTLTFSNFTSTFDFLEKNNLLGSESYLTNETKLKLNNNSSFSFETRKNKEKDLTEYYNLIYEYKNDCLIAGIEFRKDYYSDGLLQPEEQLFFSVTIVPFGKINTPDVSQ
jgi:LPS-assembly protein